MSIISRVDMLQQQKPKPYSKGVRRGSSIDYKMETINDKFPRLEIMIFVSMIVVLIL